LRESEERLALALDASNSGLWDFNPHTFTNIHYNDRWFTMLGYEPDEFPQSSETWINLMHPEDFEPVKKKLQDHIEKKSSYSAEFRMKTKSGNYRWIYALGKVVSWDKTGNPDRMIGVHIDINDLKHAREDLKASENRFRELFDNMSSAVAVYEAKDNGNDFIFKDLNRAGERIENVKREDLIGKSVLEIFPGVKEFGIFDIFDRVWKTGKAECQPISLYKDHRIASWRENYVYKLPSGEIIAVYNDVSERKRAEEKIRKNRAMLHAVFNGISSPLILLDKNLTIHILNDAAKEYYQKSGFKNTLGRPCFEAFRGKTIHCEECKIPSAVQSRQHKTFEQKSVIYPGKYEQITVYPVQEKESGVTGAIVYIRDITENKKLQEQLIRSDRLTSLGMLSGGIAHEIRNPLASIILFLDILNDKKKFDPTDKELELFNEIKNNVYKIDGIIRRVLDFAKPSLKTTTEIDINTLIRDEIKLWSTQFRKSDITSRLSLEDAIPSISGDPIEIRQVVNNLVQNAIEVMKTGGTFDIKTTRGISSFHKDRRVVLIKIKDTGPGMEPKHLHRIFNPFFTTKPNGTGLGLAITHQIIERHGGIISCEAELGKGTTFTIELPYMPGK